MFTLVSLGILVAAIVGGFQFGMTVDTMMIASALFAIAGAISTASITLAEKFGDKK